MYQVGDFYELYFDDARAAAALLSIPLSERSGFPMSSVPVNGAADCINRLRQMGHPVAICNQVVGKRRRIAECLPAVTAPENSNAPARELPAAPGPEYLKMVEARLRAMPDFRVRLEPPHCFTLNLPGLASGINTGRELFNSMIGDLHWHADTIRAALLPQIGSAWELVELEELLAIGADIVGDDRVEIPNDSQVPVRWSIRESCSLMHRSNWTLRETMVFGAFVLNWHSAAISKLVLPKLKITDALQVAQSLVIAEQVVMSGSKEARVPENHGTIAQPTKLQEQAWSLAARLWQEWPRDKTFSQVDEEPDDVIGQRVGVAPSATEPGHKAA